MTNDFIALESALETLAVSVWSTAESTNDTAAWSHVYDSLSGVELYLTCLRIYPLAATASELKSLAGVRASMLRNANAKALLQGHSGAPHPGGASGVF
jgi:hypothetical protein